jgi:FlaG/FlaF family flagellin (archaellin)
MDRTSGVSEIIGAVLLITLVVVALAVVGAVLFAQATPQKVPNINFMTGSDGNGNLLLFHNGGDNLKMGEFSVTVDGTPRTATLSGGGTEWSLGKTLQVSGVSSGSHTVQIIYNGTSTSSGSGSTGETLLRTASANVSTTSYLNVSSDEPPVIDCSAVRNPACYDQISPDTINALYLRNTTQKLIRFTEASQARGAISGAAGTAYHFNFTVSNNNSTLTTGANSANGDLCIALGTTYRLVNGDKVGIVLTADPDNFYVYGTDSQIWFLSAGGRTRLTIKIYNQTNTKASLVGTNSVCSAYIDQYTNLDSTIQITSQTVNVIKYLKVNNTDYINGVNTSSITLNNAQPIPNGQFLLTYAGANEQVRFIGWADSITGITGPLGL